jgi:hypothetical protein
LFVRRNEIQLAALLDVVIGDGLAVDHNRYALSMYGRCAGEQNQNRSAR